MRRNPKLEQALNDAERERRCLRTSDRNLQRALAQRHRAGELLRIMPGLYVRPSHWGSLGNRERIMHVLRAECAAHPDWVLAGISAATVWGLTESTFLNRKVHWAKDFAHASADRGHYAFHAMHKDETRKVIVDGLPVTSIHRTMFDCVRCLPLPDALAILEAALRLGRTVKSRFESYLAGKRGCKGIRSALIATRYANGLSENGGEAISLGYLIQWGYEPPRQQVWWTDPVTGQRRRVDFLWFRADGRPIIGELDGRGKYVDPAMTGGRDIESVVIEEKDRESNLALDGKAIFVRWTFNQLIRHPELVRRKLDLAGVPKTRNLANS